MNFNELNQNILDILRAYWRILASLAIYKNYASEEIAIETIMYANIPTSGNISGFLTGETVKQAIAQVEIYAQDRLASDFFLSLISQFESFLSEKLRCIGKNGSGTFGAIQINIQSSYSIPQKLRDDLDEIRERRNCLIHHHGQPNSKYITAANKIWASSNGNVNDPSTITVLKISQAYLVYVADIILSYSKNL